MKQYHLNDFDKNNAWLVFRLDVKVADDFLDMYLLMHLPSESILGHQIIEHEITQKHLDDLFKLAASCGKVPDRVLLAKGDPAELCIQACAEKFSMNLETVPKPSLDPLLVTVRRSFGSCFLSPSTIGHLPTKEGDDCDPEAIKQFIPDSYDPCPCASGKKYKFCCKKIFHEIINAMVAAEDGNQIEAIQWIEKAKTLVGNTSEVLCREAIVSSFFDPQKGYELIEKCLALYPNHPRANYIRAIDLCNFGDLEGAIRSYQTAISHCPETNHFHLNEIYNNLGTVFYELGDLDQAKSAWEKALLYLPSDKITQQNLREFIYCQSDKIF